MPSRAEKRFRPPVSRPGASTPSRVEAPAGLSGPVVPGSGSPPTSNWPVFMLLPMGTVAAAWTEPLGAPGQERATGAASTHAVDRSMEPTVPSSGPSPQSLAPAVEAKTGGPARSTPVHTQAEAWRTGARPRAAVMSTAVVRTWRSCS